MAKFKQSRRDLSKRPQKGPSKPRQTERKSSPSSSGNRGERSENSGYFWIFGTHATFAAIANPARKFRRILLTRSAAETLAEQMKGKMPSVEPEICERHVIDDLLPDGVVHQGVAALTAELEDFGIEGLCRSLSEAESARVVVLDQATDPRNIGAVLRSAAAFGASAVIIQDRNGPEMGGTLAKAASGALETVPLIRQTNLSRCLKSLKDAGFWCVGLDGNTSDQLGDLNLSGKIALILGSEGSGLRRLVKENCDHVAKIPIQSAMESLNLSNAAAIALYETIRSK